MTMPSGMNKTDLFAPKTPLAEWLTVVAILLLAAALRLADLERVPPALNVDEAVNAYEAYSLLNTGRDEWGAPWPVTMRTFNDYRRPAIVYSAIPFIAVFDLTIFGIRATAAFWGWLGVLFTYRLARDMFGRQVGVLAGLMLALSPWHIGLSRIGMEGTSLAFLVVAGMWCLWRWYQGRRQRWLIAAGVVWGLSLYTYTPTQALTPLLLLACGVIFFKQLWQQRRATLLGALLFLLVAAPLVYTIVTNEVTWNRLKVVSLFRPGEPLVPTLRLAGRQWLGHYSPAYLFLRGDADEVLHAQGFGQLYWLDMLLLPLGLVGLAQGRYDRRAVALLLAWIALASLPAALTVTYKGLPHSLRGIPVLPAWMTLSALGIQTIWGARRLAPRWKAALLGLLASALVWNAALVLKHYFVVYPVQSARAFEYGIKEAMDYVTAHEDEYETIVLTNWISQPHIFAVFFQKYDPRAFQETHAEYGTGLSEKLSRWGAKYMTGDVDQLYHQLEHGLFVARPHMLPGVEPTLLIYHPDGSPAFKIVVK
jgi:4-amino-4-deoxy-L-arabinose transferase-like glycosyltransferase